MHIFVTGLVVMILFVAILAYVHLFCTPKPETPETPEQICSRVKRQSQGKQ